MTDIYTRIQIRGAKHSSGLMDWGVKTHADMVAHLRAYAEQQLAEAQEVLATPDSGFDVDIVRGCMVQHFVRKVLPEGKS
jgi:hypothetical protein